MSTTARVERRSPLREEPLPQAGASLRARLEAYLDNEVMERLTLFAVATALALLEWMRWWFAWPPMPGLATGVAALYGAWFLFHFRRDVRRVRAMRLGLDGEIAVGQRLETLRAQGYHVFHDVPGTGGNLDHVVVGPAGIYVVEDKTWSKPATRAGTPTITYHQADERLLVDGVPSTHSPLPQALACAGELERVLCRLDGRAWTVQPVVVFPGWFVRTTPEPWKCRVMLFNHDGFVTWLRKQRAVLTPAEVGRLAEWVGRHVRAGAAK